VRDKQIRNIQFFLQIFKRIDNLRLNRHIQSGNGSSQTMNLGLNRKRARNADSLPLSAGKFVRVAVRMLAVQSPPDPAVP
jgi:hypothetical protein